MRKRFYVILILLPLSVLPCFAQLGLVADKTSVQIGDTYTVKKDVAYGSDVEQKMDIYISRDAKNLGKRNFTIVFIHGGGYYLSDKSKEEKYIEPYLRKGLNVVNINYRLKKGIPIATEDLTHALNFLKESESNYPLNLKQVVLSGFSAGAQMASNVGLAQNDRDYPHPLVAGIRVRGIINFSGPVDGLDTVERVFMGHELPIMKEIGNALFPSSSGYAPKDVISVYEPISYYDRKDPPFFLWYGGKDDQIPPVTFQQFLPLLAKEKGKNRVIFCPDGLHSPNKKELQEAYLEVFSFLGSL